MSPAGLASFQGVATADRGIVRHDGAGAPGPVSWHALDIAATLERLGSSPGGLTAGEAAARLAIYGANRLRVAPPASAWKIFRAQFRSVVVVLLGVATGVSAVTGDWPDAIAIAAVDAQIRAARA